MQGEGNSQPKAAGEQPQPPSSSANVGRSSLSSAVPRHHLAWLVRCPSFQVASAETEQSCEATARRRPCIAHGVASQLKGGRLALGGGDSFIVLRSAWWRPRASERAEQSRAERALVTSSTTFAPLSAQRISITRCWPASSSLVTLPLCAVSLVECLSVAVLLCGCPR